MLTTNDLMTIDPVVIAPTASLREVVALMNKHGVRQVLVVDHDQLVGVLTDRDLRLAVNSPLLSSAPEARIEMLDTFTADSCMTRNPMTVTPQTPIHEVARLMADHKFGAFPVIADGKLAGIITVTDLLNQMALIPEPDGLTR